jgi:hypothetical protein
MVPRTPLAFSLALLRLEKMLTGLSWSKPMKRRTFLGVTLLYRARNLSWVSVMFSGAFHSVNSGFFSWGSRDMMYMIFKTLAVFWALSIYLAIQ